MPALFFWSDPRDPLLFTSPSLYSPSCAFFFLEGVFGFFFVHVTMALSSVFFLCLFYGPAVASPTNHRPSVRITFCDYWIPALLFVEFFLFPRFFSAPRVRVLKRYTFPQVRQPGSSLS